VRGRCGLSSKFFDHLLLVSTDYHSLLLTTLAVLVDNSVRRVRVCDYELDCHSVNFGHINLDVSKTADGIWCMLVYPANRSCSKVKVTGQSSQFYKVTKYSCFFPA